MAKTIAGFGDAVRALQLWPTTAVPGQRSPTPKVRFALDSLLEEAVSSEPVSEAKFPASREFTGNFIDSELSGASTRAKKAINSVPYEPIPYASEQGIFWGLARN
jgi:hypothetical protein